MSRERAKINITSFLTRQKITTILSATFVAFLLWLFVKSEEEYTTSLEMPVEIRNLPSSFILNEEVPKVALAQIKGHGRSLFKTFLLKRFFTEFKLVLDLEKISEEYNFVLNEYFDEYPQKVVIPPSFDISFIEILRPNSIHISLNEYKEKEVFVRPNVYVLPKAGFTLVGQPEFKPRNIRITGSRNLVETIYYANTSPDTILDADKNISISLPIDPPDNQVLEYSHSELFYTQRVQKIGERIISEIPVKILNQDSQMRIFSSPQTVSLTVVGGIEYISNLKPSELEVSVDFNNWREDKQFYEIRVNTPNDVLDWMDLSPMSIELIVTQKNS